MSARARSEMELDPAALPIPQSFCCPITQDVRRSAEALLFFLLRVGSAALQMLQGKLMELTEIEGLPA